jgi:CubicO group peptidase (beta-lactamase class C family)
VTLAGQLIALKSFGHFTYKKNPEGAPSLSVRSLERNGGDVDSLEITSKTLFDIASLTKPVATTTMAMILYERGFLELEAPVTGALPEFANAAGTPDPRRRDVTFRMVLAHSSGLPAYEKLFLRARERNDLLRAALATPFTADPASRAEYSDIGFILLALALERIAGESLDVFCAREIFGPLSMAHTTFNPPQSLRPQIPPTADEREDQERGGAGAHAREMPPGASLTKPRSTFRNRVIQGEVQDENAYVLGGVAGHAGLFSTAEDISRFAQAMLNGGAPILRPETVALFTQAETAPTGTTRTLGWDTPSSPSQSGKYFGPGSYGHLGYTGTSLWIDPARRLSITLLTNRTWPDCSNPAIKQVRPKFHDAIVEALVK